MSPVKYRSMFISWVWSEYGHYGLQKTKATEWARMSGFKQFSNETPILIYSNSNLLLLCRIISRNISWETNEQLTSRVS